MKPSVLPALQSAAAARLTGFFLLWLMLMPSAKPADLIFGVAHGAGGDGAQPQAV